MLFGLFLQKYVWNCHLVTNCINTTHKISYSLKHFSLQFPITFLFSLDGFSDAFENTLTSCVFLTFYKSSVDEVQYSPLLLLLPCQQTGMERWPHNYTHWPCFTLLVSSLSWALNFRLLGRL